MRRFALVLGLGLSLGLTAGCASESAKKAKACETDSTALEESDACKKCCEEAGAAGFSYMNLGEAECKCL